MSSLHHRVIGVILAVVCFAGQAWAAVTEGKSVELPAWLAQVPVLNSGGEQAFQFRANLDAAGVRLQAYVSSSPPNHRCVVFCDAHDGLPLIVAIDGEAWIYDLISGQIVHYKTESKFDLLVKDDQVEFNWGILKAGQGEGIHVDVASFLTTPNISELEAMKSATNRFAAGSTARGSKAILEVTASDPPLPTRLILALASTPPGHIECDGFRFGEPLPQWGRPLNAETLMKDVPYLDAADMKDAPKDKQELLAITTKLLFGGATFLLRPALRDPAARQKLEQSSPKLDFKELDLHEKLLRDAWLRALEHQGFVPAKSFPPLSPEWAK
jgi:hypothetical protein